MRKFFCSTLAFCSLAFFAGCKKDSDNKLTGAYETADHLNIEAPVMYTKSNIITDVQFIKNYLARDTFFSGEKDTSFIFDRSTEAYRMNIKVDFIGDTAVIDFPLGTSTVSQKRLLKQKNSEELILETVDTLAVYFSGTSKPRIYSMSYWMEKNNIGDLVYNLNYFQSFATAKYRSSLIQSNGKLIMPIVRTHSRLVNLNGDIGGRYWYNNSWGYFNKNIAEHLAPGDTIVVQSKTAELIRQ